MTWCPRPEARPWPPCWWLGLVAARLAVSRDDGPTDVAADAAGLGSSGFGGGASAFQPDLGDEQPPADDFFATDPFDSQASRFNFGSRFDDGSISSSPPPSPLRLRSAQTPRASPPPAPAPPAPAPLAPPPASGPDPTPPPPAPPVVPPLAFVGEPVWGIDEEPSATVMLRLQDPAAEPNVPSEVHELATGNDWHRPTGGLARRVSVPRPESSPNSGSASGPAGPGTSTPPAPTRRARRPGSSCAGSSPGRSSCPGTA